MDAEMTNSMSSDGRLQKKTPQLNKRSSLWKRIVERKYLYLLALPGLLSLFFFKYLPMPGIIIAFQDYSIYGGIANSEWVGMEHFLKLFRDPDFFMILRNALVISLLSLLVFPLPVLLALLLNEIRREFVKRSIQTMVYLPHFLSWVIVVSLTYLFLSKEQGFINSMLEAIGLSRMEFLFNEDFFYPLIVLQNVWKDIGWNSIIYLAAIAGIDPSLYEAAKMDGAGRWRQMWYVTVPSLIPVMVIMFVLVLGYTLDVNFEQLYLMQNPINQHVSEVFETYVYKQGIRGGEFSYTTAVGIFKSLVGLLLVLGSNYVVKKRGHEGLY
jgi:putative aldouronate transport system permease protein